MGKDLFKKGKIQIVKEIILQGKGSYGTPVRRLYTDYRNTLSKIYIYRQIRHVWHYKINVFMAFVMK